METDDDIMTAEEFFGVPEKSAGRTRRKSRARGKRNPDDLFADVKVKMVMRIRGVSRAKALEIISARAAEKAEEEVAGPRDARTMSAAEFFGEV